MITCTNGISGKKMDVVQDCSFGNVLFRIASTIGIAIKNGYEYGFQRWSNQEFFINELPRAGIIPKIFHMPKNFMNYDFGFQTFEVPDNVTISGEMATYKYFDHCKDLIRHYFTMKEICEPYRDHIIIHFRHTNQGNFVNQTAFTNLKQDYYHKAIKQFPKKKILVVTDGIDQAMKDVDLDAEYTSNTPIIDFYLVSHADYLIMSNSTFSWWGAFLSDCPTVAPVKWYGEPLKDAPSKDLYLPNWILI